MKIPTYLSVTEMSIYHRGSNEEIVGSTLNKFSKENQYLKKKVLIYLKVSTIYIIIYTVYKNSSEPKAPLCPFPHH